MTRREAYNQACSDLEEPALKEFLRNPKDSLNKPEHLLTLLEILENLAYATRDPVLKDWALSDPSLARIRSARFGERLAAMSKIGAKVKVILRLWAAVFGVQATDGPDSLAVSGDIVMQHKFW